MVGDLRFIGQAGPESAATAERRPWPVRGVAGVPVVVFVPAPRAHEQEYGDAADDEQDAEPEEDQGMPG